ncbi:MAG: BolA family protein [Nitrospinales bacterium]
MQPIDIIESILKEHLEATYVQIVDESYLHAGHKAAGGGGHFRVTVVSPRFENVNLIDQRRMVYGALDAQLHGSPKLIHALQIKTYTPRQWRQAN